MREASAFTIKKKCSYKNLQFREMYRYKYLNIQLGATAWRQTRRKTI